MIARIAELVVAHANVSSILGTTAGSDMIVDGRSIVVLGWSTQWLRFHPVRWFCSSYSSQNLPNLTLSLPAHQLMRSWYRRETTHLVDYWLFEVALPLAFVPVEADVFSMQLKAGSADIPWAGLSAGTGVKEFQLERKQC